MWFEFGFLVTISPT